MLIPLPLGPGQVLALLVGLLRVPPPLRQPHLAILLVIAIQLLRKRLHIPGHLVLPKLFLVLILLVFRHSIFLVVPLSDRSQGRLLPFTFRLEYNGVHLGHIQLSIVLIGRRSQVVEVCGLALVLVAVELRLGD